MASPKSRLLGCDPAALACRVVPLLPSRVPDLGLGAPGVDPEAGEDGGYRTQPSNSIHDLAWPPGRRLVAAAQGTQDVIIVSAALTILQAGRHHPRPGRKTGIRNPWRRGHPTGDASPTALLGSRETGVGHAREAVKIAREACRTSGESATRVQATAARNPHTAFLCACASMAYGVGRNGDDRYPSYA